MLSTMPRVLRNPKIVGRRTIKYNFLTLRVDKKTDEEIRKQLHSRYRTQQRNRDQMDVYELLEIYLTAITTSLDPHTTYMAPRAQNNFDIQLKLSLDGIGASLKSEDGYVTVAMIVPGGAADKDGRLKKGDKIVAVGQEGEHRRCRRCREEDGRRSRSHSRPSRFQGSIDH